MENWSKRNFLGIFFLLLLSFAFQSSENRAVWGFFGHKRINRMATFCLPPSMFGFYKEHIEYLTEHAVDPDKRRYALDGEAQCHYIDLDHFLKKDEVISEVMPRNWKDAVEKFTEDTLQTYGIVPWHIVKMKYRLQKAFEEGNVDLILKYSADIGHYIGDAHVPLHTTENYNGQLTGQKGIHGLWESRLVEMNAESFDYFIGKAKYIENLSVFVWDIIEESHLAVDSVLMMEKEVTTLVPVDQKYVFEDRNKTTVRTYSKEFSDLYHQRLNGMVERRLKKSIYAVGSIWFTAWVDAGQPDLGKLQNIPPSQDLMEELKKLDQEYISDKIKGRICD